MRFVEDPLNTAKPDLPPGFANRSRFNYIGCDDCASRCSDVLVSHIAHLGHSPVPKASEYLDSPRTLAADLNRELEWSNLNPSLCRVCCPCCRERIPYFLHSLLEHRSHLQMVTQYGISLLRDWRFDCDEVMKRLKAVGEVSGVDTADKHDSLAPLDRSWDEVDSDQE